MAVTALAYGPTLAGVAISAGTASVNAGTAVFSNSNNVSFGVNGSTITASASAAAAPNMSMWYLTPLPGGAGNMSLLSTPWFFPLNAYAPVAGAMTFDSMGLGISGASNTSSYTAHTWSMSVGLYQLSNSTRLSLINSVSSSFGTNASDANGFQSYYAGNRYITFVSSQWSAAPAVSAGGSYWMGIGVQTAGATVSVNLQGANIVPAAAFSGEVGAVSYTNRPSLPFLGAYTATTGALPSAVSIGEVVASTQPFTGPALMFFAKGISWQP